MEIEIVGLWVYLIYLVLPFYLGARIASKILAEQRNLIHVLTVGIMFNLMFYIVGLIL
jgi:hypothetical protein